jgi:phosphocarrier protein HPr
MSTSPVTRVIVIENPQGFHARPAELFARLALKFESQVALVRGDQRADGKSILEILTLGVQPGTELTLEAQGNDAEQAVDALARLVEGHFEGSASGDQEQSG